MACVTGNGTVLTYTHAGIPGPTGTLVALGGVNQVIPMIDDNDLVAGAIDKQCVGDLVTQGPLVFTVKWDDTTKGDMDTHDVGDLITTLSITFPEGGDSLLLAAGAISERDIAAFENNTRILVTYTISPTTAAWVYSIA